MPPIRLALLQEDPDREPRPDQQKATRYEIHGYHEQSRRHDDERRTRCRVTDTADDSWVCLKHRRHIIICLNERVEREVRELSARLAEGLAHD